MEQEEAALSASKAKTKPDLAPKKVTQAQIQQRQGEAAAAILIGISHIHCPSLVHSFS